MITLRSLVALLAGTSALLAQSAYGYGERMSKKELHARQAEAAKRWVNTPHKRDTTVTNTTATANNTIVFKNPKAAR